MLVSTMYVIIGKRSKFCSLIKPEEWWVITFLASGDDQQWSSFSFRTDKWPKSTIISETIEVIYSSRRDEYLKVPCTPQAWQEISKDFETILNFPHRIGTLDGKHIKVASAD